jgi:hypothetical protein
LAVGVDSVVFRIIKFKKERKKENKLCLTKLFCWEE